MGRNEKFRGLGFGFGMVMYQAAGLPEKAMYYLEKISLMKLLSTDVPLADAKLMYIPL